ncbi:MAG: hypothetical protein ACREMM_08100 [Gemmatimonadales bacterium]
MAKPLLQLAAVGIVGVALWKVFTVFMLPLLGFLLKIAVLVAFALFLVWLFRKRDDDTRTDGKTATSPPPAA